MARCKNIGVLSRKSRLLHQNSLTHPARNGDCPSSTKLWVKSTFDTGGACIFSLRSCFREILGREESEGYGGLQAGGTTPMRDSEERIFGITIMSCCIYNRSDPDEIPWDRW
jgi:hypothetical protein